ncbi:helix-turn-helix transcriptional regulator [Phycicoccus avicenniae]|uniref:helix-turn-helix transcriptional regulator n=1 Tax=Phycicoccus avicenniae TaxID=2828860 RepID=UPI003D273CDF
MRLSYNFTEVRQLLQVDLELLFRAVHKTDPYTHPYPPILPVAGQHGYGGKYAILSSDVYEWGQKLIEPGLRPLEEDSWDAMKKQPVPRMALTVREAAQAVGVSPSTILKAIKATNPREYPPPLKAGRHGPTGRYSVRPADLEEWVKSLGQWW